MSDREIQYCELDETNRNYLHEIGNLEHVGDDFLKFNEMTFDRIIANPPFAKNQDCKHIKHMYSEYLNSSREIINRNNLY